MLKLSELHARHQPLYLSLVLRGFKTPGTRLWLILPPPVMKTLQWRSGQRLRCKWSSTGLVMTPRCQASTVRKTVPSKTTQAQMVRQNLAWQACLKGLKRSARTKGLVRRGQPGLGPTPVEPAAGLMSEEPVNFETVNADEQEASSATAGVVPLGRFRCLVKHLEIVFLVLLLLMFVLGTFLPMAMYAYHHVFLGEPVTSFTACKTMGGRGEDHDELMRMSEGSHSYLPSWSDAVGPVKHAGIRH